MKLFAGLFGRKRAPSAAEEAEYILTPAQHISDPVDILKLPEVDGVPAPQPHVETPSEGDMMERVAQEAQDDDATAPTPAPQAAVNIWDLDDDDQDAPASAAPVAAAPDRATSRARRNRTRLIGFDKSDGDVVDLFDDKAQSAPVSTVQFPVGWLLVVEGPGRGSCFALVAGMSQIGRGEDQTVRLDFGDSAISRQNHAAIVFDSESRKFILGHGGKANIVRLNNNPVISNEDLSDGDQIKIGDTVIQLKTLCGADFAWADTAEPEERDDVAIA